MRKYCDEKIDFKILMDLRIFRLGEYEKVVFGMPFVCLCLCSASCKRLSGWADLFM
jgi:hypothetical protein